MTIPNVLLNDGHQLPMLGLNLPDLQLKKIRFCHDHDGYWSQTVPPTMITRNRGQLIRQSGIP